LPYFVASYTELLLGISPLFSPPQAQLSPLNRNSKVPVGSLAGSGYNRFDLIHTKTYRKGVVMTSPKKVQANRQNALKSTGPKTQQGKDIARLNATKHGLLSREALIPGEDEAALEELSERLRAELQPIGELESLLVEDIVTARWRLRRFRRVEAGVFAPELRDIYTQRIASENETAALGLSFIRKADGFSTLSRYEAAIERSLYKALHELQRLQAARSADVNVPPPAVLDVDVSGVSREEL